MSLASRQFSTFYLDNRLYGIEVTEVQEVAIVSRITRIPLAPSYIRGVINLRGQIATAVELRDLFGISTSVQTEQMSVVSKVEDVLLSLLVDKIGDVVEVSQSDYEPIPETVPASVRRFADGVYKTDREIMTVITADKVFKAINSNEKEKTYEK